MRAIISAVAAAVVVGVSDVSAFSWHHNRMTPPRLVAEGVEFGSHSSSGGVDQDFSASTNDSDMKYFATGTFDQLLDHSNPSLGTFNQRFWWSTQYWTGPGAPVVFFTPGETDAGNFTGYLTNSTITGLFAQAIGGAVVMLEHRYWGESSPFADLTTKNLKYLTLANAIADTTHFARNVSLPFDTSGASNAPAAPWVMSGGSYSGALTAWVEHGDPGTFWAYHASSAVVQSIADFWQYFAPVQQGMPKNCSADVQRVISHIDYVLENGSDDDIQALKEQFGLGGVEHNDDFVSVIASGPYEWQSNSFASGYSSFYEFCDYVENVASGAFNRTCKPGPNGVGLKKALKGYAKWIKDILVPDTCADTGYFQGSTNVECFDTYNVSNPILSDISVDNMGGRQWMWMLCNEPFMFWQDGAPPGTPTLVSRLLNVDYFERQCGLYFPPEDGYTFGSANGLTPDDVNTITGGWSNANTTRLVWANGQYDPWKDATVSSDYRPGGPLVSTTDAPVYVIPNGIHCSDLLYRNAKANDGVLAVVNSEIATIKGWVDKFYATT